MESSSARGPLPEIVLCGYERGGTTLLSQIFRENGFVSGFEVGVLMCRSPEEFMRYKPYCDMLHAGWGLGQRISLTELCQGSFEYFYKTLATTAYPRKIKQRFFDKTPIYMSRLGYVLQQTEFIKKAVVITRDPRAVFTSWAKRQLGDAPTPKAVEKEIKRRLSPYASRYLDYFAGCIAQRNSPNVMFVAYEALCLSPQPVLQAMGEFAVGQPFTLERMNHNYKNVYGDAISTDNVREFEHYLSQNTQRLILNATREAAPFFLRDGDLSEHERSWDALRASVDRVLRRYKISHSSEYLDGVYFEPETYLIRNRDVLENGADPRRHFLKYGKSESRKPC